MIERTIADIIASHYGWQGCQIKKLNGYANVNYLVQYQDRKFIFKTYRWQQGLQDILEAENQTLQHLHKNGRHHIPEPVSKTSGELLFSAKIEGFPSVCRMLSYVDGDFMANVSPSTEIAATLGSVLATIDKQLAPLHLPALQARKWPWDIQHLSLVKPYVKFISNPHDQSIVRYFMQQFDQEVLPRLADCRKQVIYNDANEWNILIADGRVHGLIDFGDLAHSALINEVAVAIVYLCYDKADPLAWAKILLQSYHETFPLEEREIELLYYLIAARLCLSVCNAANSRHEDPDNQYATVSENSAWNMLRHWLTLNPQGVQNVFRETVGMKPIKVPGLTQKLKDRRQHLSSILSISYQEPIVMEKAAFQYMYDAYGHCFLDAYNNIPHVGHSHPVVVEAGQRQMARLNTNTRYLFDLLAEYAEQLLQKFPSPLNRVFFVNSGSAASDLAMRLAYTHTGLKKVMVMEHGYHGNTQIAMDISNYKFGNKKGSGPKNHIITTPIPDTYKGQYQSGIRDAGQLYAKQAIAQIEESHEAIGAFISEPIVGCGGQVPLPPGYLREIYPVIQAQGGVCISDEVQTGFGRLGDLFWGFEDQGVIPDLVVLGKPMGNGHPIGAVVCTEEIASSFENGVEFFSSFGGNPVSCAIGLAVLDVIEKEGLQQNAQTVGNYYLKLFRELQQDFPCIGDVRGSGLFIGVELVQEGTTSPNTSLAQALKNELRDRHILISTDGPADNVLKTKPPLCFTKENAKEVVDNISQILNVHS